MVCLLAAGCVYVPAPYYDQPYIRYVHPHRPTLYRDDAIGRRPEPDAPGEPRRQDVGPLVDVPKELPAGNAAVATSQNKPDPPEAPSSSSPPVPPAPKSSGTEPAKESSSEPPLGIKTSRAGRVKSPFFPNRELDVTDLHSGDLAKDPISGKIFRVP
jgi:hypothetical protein